MKLRIRQGEVSTIVRDWTSRLCGGRCLLMYSYYRGAEEHSGGKYEDDFDGHI